MNCKICTMRLTRKSCVNDNRTICTACKSIINSGEYEIVINNDEDKNNSINSQTRCSNEDCNKNNSIRSLRISSSSLSGLCDETSYDSVSESTTETSLEVSLTW